MSINRKPTRRMGRQAATPPHAGKPSPAQGPVEPNLSGGSETVTAAAPDEVMKQAKRDLDAGQVDTDMRATPGLDAKRRSILVPGPGGKPPASKG